MVIKPFEETYKGNGYYKREGPEQKQQDAADVGITFYDQPLQHFGDNHCWHTQKQHVISPRRVVKFGTVDMMDGGQDHEGMAVKTGP